MLLRMIRLKYLATGFHASLSFLSTPRRCSDLMRQNYPHRRSSPVSLETYPLYYILQLRSNGNDRLKLIGSKMIGSNREKKEVRFSLSPKKTFITVYRPLSSSLDMFKFEMIVDDSFWRLNQRMIVHDSDVWNVSTSAQRTEWVGCFSSSFFKGLDRV